MKVSCRVSTSAVLLGFFVLFWKGYLRLFELKFKLHLFCKISMGKGFASLQKLFRLLLIEICSEYTYAMCKNRRDLSLQTPFCTDYWRAAHSVTFYNTDGLLSKWYLEWWYSVPNKMDNEVGFNSSVLFRTRTYLQRCNLSWQTVNQLGEVNGCPNVFLNNNLLLILK